MIHSYINNRPVLLSAFSLFFILSLHIRAQVPVINVPSEITFTQGINNPDLIISNTGGAIPQKLFAKVEDIPASGSPPMLQQMVKGADGNFYGFESFSYRIIKIVQGGGATVFAGGSDAGYIDGEKTAARFMELTKIAVDLTGNFYLAEINKNDARDSRIRKITPDGKVSTFATGLRNPRGLAIDDDGYIYVSEGSWIRKYNSSGQYTIFAGQSGPGIRDGQGSDASFTNPSNLVFDPSGDLYVAEDYSFTRKVSPQGYVSTLSVRKISTESVVIDVSGNFYSSANGSGLIITFPSGQQAKVIFSNTGGLAKVGDDIYISRGNKLSRMPIVGYYINPFLPNGLTLKATGRIGGRADGLLPPAEVKVMAFNKWGSSSAPLRIITEMQKVSATVKSFTPLRAAVNTEITIKGSRFLGATGVKIGGIAAESFSITDSTRISAIVAKGTASGSIDVINPYGTSSITGFILIEPAVIDSFSPQSAQKGNEVIITGKNFEQVESVWFGDYPASSFNVISSTTIRAVVGNGGSGNIVVFAAAGGGTKSGFIFIGPPVISSFTQNAGAGTEVTISGTGFTGATSVKFGGKAATSFIVVSGTSIKAIVGTGSSGQVSVTTPAGTGTKDGFNWIAPPTITSFTPNQLAQGRQIFISGTNLAFTTAVTLGGVPATIYSKSDNYISAVIGPGNSGPLKVVTMGGSASIDGFTFIPPPVITGFSPQSGHKGDLISITGENFKEQSSVAFGGYYSDSVKVISSTNIVARVGFGASGAVTVYDAGGNGSLAGFIHSGPAISSFIPMSGRPGTAVTITGKDFTDISQVYFGNIPAASFTVNSPTSITAICGEGETGYIRVSGKYGVVTSVNAFLHASPLISYFYNTAAAAGSEVRIIGERFTGVTSVRFGGIEAVSFSIISDKEIAAIVGSAGASGKITLKSAAGSTSRDGFVFLTAPDLIAFSPESAGPGEKITLSGRNFSNVQSVQISGVYLSFTRYSDSSIVAVVPVKSVSGAIVVSSYLGTDSLGYFTHTGPVISSFEPRMAAAGKKLTIWGRNFSGVSALNFGAVAASAFTVISDTEISVIVPSGAGSTIEIKKGTGSVTVQGFTFISMPSIQKFEPIAAGAVSPVDIFGANFYKVESVYFGGKPARSFTVESPSKIIAYPPDGSSGSIEVFTEAGKVDKEGFIWVDKPHVLSFSPDTVISGTSITITGSNFSGVTSVTFGGMPASWFNVVSPTSIIAVAASGRTGYVSVSTTGGRDSIGGFTFIHPPVISSFLTTGEGPNMTVIIKGEHLSAATSVTFGNVNAKSFRVNSPNEISAVVGAGETGSISVTTRAGTAELKGFLYRKPPVITSIVPLSGTVGSSVTITGYDFNPLLSGNKVYFGSIAARILSASDTVIKVSVPGSAVNQPLSVINLVNGLSTVSSQQFRIMQPRSAWSDALLSEKTDIILQDRPEDIMIADIDSDGRNDLISSLTTGYPANSVTDLVIYRNNVSGGINVDSFSDTVRIRLPFNGGFNIGDISGDGLKDIVSGSENQMFVLINTSTPGNISFRREVINVFAGGSVADIRDFDLDGKNDLLVNSFGSLSLYRNTSTFLPGAALSFAGREAIGVDNGFSSFPAIDDLDADRKPDFIMDNSGFSRFGVAQNISTPGKLNSRSFNNQIRIPSVVFSSFRMFTGDVNGDDKVDIIEQGIYPGFFAIYENKHISGTINESSFVFSQKINFDGGTSVSPHVVDMNGDSKKDIISLSTTGVKMLKNTGSSKSPAWEEQILYVSDGQYQGEIVHSGMAAADLNGDGLPELVLVNSKNYKLTILHSSPIEAPVINSFEPTVAPENDAVFISGKNFSTIKSVSFGGVPAKDFTLISDSTIYAIVPKTSSGQVRVENQAGNTSMDGFKFTYAPVISSISPSAAIVGAAVTIIGKNFEDVLQVSFRDEIASFTVNSPTSITAFVPPGAQDTIWVLTRGGLDSYIGFTPVTKPVLSAKGDTTFSAGGSVVLSVNAASDSAYNWYRNGVIIPDVHSASIRVKESGTYTAAIGLSGLLFNSNEIIVTVIDDPVKYAVINSFNPTTAPEGATVIIAGENLSTVKSVSFGGVPAKEFTLRSDSTIYAIVPKTSSGSVKVENLAGSASIEGFKFIDAPVISSFSPSAALEGAAVTISGAHFDNTSAVSFGSLLASFKVNSPTSITAYVPAGSRDTIRILSPGGLAVASGFTRVIKPVISALGDTTFTAGGSVVLSTSPNAGYSYRWQRNGLPVPDARSSSITVTESGIYKAVIELNGYLFDSNEIIVTSVIPPAKPAVITSFIPTAAPEGASVFISGQNFSTVRSVSFGGVPATDFQLISDNTIYAIVPKTSSGAVMVINQGGSASMDGFKFAYAPVISSFSPAAGTEGTAVSISGKNFDDVIDVSFGGVVAAFTVNSPTSLTAFVPAGALDTIRILTSGGLASVTGFSRVTRPVISAQGNTTFGTGGSVVLNASPASGKTYRWYRNGIIIPEAGSSSIVATESGTYSAAIEVNGLIFTSNEIPVKVILVLPASNFKIQITAVSCRTENNGVLNITAGKPLDYILSVQGNNLQSSYTFNSSKEIQGLSAGRYSLCFTVAGQPDFKQCFDVVVTEPEDLSLLSYVDEGRNTLTLNMSGGEQYYIKLNDRLYQTAGTGIELPLDMGINQLSVWTDKDCQGKISKTISVLPGESAYPNPFVKEVNISVGKEYRTATIKVLDTGGKIVYSGKHTADDGVYSLNLEYLPAGIYMLQLHTGTGIKTFKIIKR